MTITAIIVSIISFIVLTAYTYWILISQYHFPFQLLGGFVLGGIIGFLIAKLSFIILLEVCAFISATVIHYFIFIRPRTTSE